MVKPKNIKWHLISSMIIIFTFILLYTNIVSGQADPFAEIQGKLADISEEEKKIVQNLFTLVQDIEIVEREEKELAQEIEMINQDIDRLESTIADEEAAFEKKQEGLKQVLKSYQRMGPGSFLEIILNSDSLSSFFRRVNTIRDLTRDTGKLLEQLEASQEKLSERKTNLIKNLTLLENKQEDSREVLAKKLVLKESIEEYLVSLMGERGYYQEHLTNMQNVWDELKPLFADTAREFSSIIQDGSLPTDALKISFSSFNIKGSIDEKIINDIISKQTSLEKMTFNFQPDKVEVKLPEKNLILSGTFIILEGDILKFQAQEGSFYGMPLESGSIEELFRENQLVLDLKPVLDGHTLQSLEIKEDYLELMIKLKLF